MSEEMFSTDMPDLESFIRQLDMFDDEQNKVILETMHDIGNNIEHSQKRLISKSKVADLLIDAIEQSSIYTNKNGVICVSVGYHTDVFNYKDTERKQFRTHTVSRQGIVHDADYWMYADREHAGVIGLTYEFGRPGKSAPHHRNSPKMKQVRKRIPNKKGTKRKYWMKAVPTEISINKGVIQPVPHIRRGFDMVLGQNIDQLVNAVNRVLDKLSDGG